MNRIKTLIIDDEKLARELIKGYMQHFPELELMGECTNGYEGLKIINETPPDLLFLDIQMPKITGFEMLELIDEPPVIVFTTAYDQYAIKAFEVNAVDYLLKPISKERFAAAVEKALKLISNKTTGSTAVNKLLNNPGETPDYINRIIVKHGNKILIIPAEDISWIEAQDDYVMIHTGTGKYLKQKTMTSLEKSLDPGDFVRIHRSYIIRLKALKRIVLMEKDAYKVILDDETSLPASKTGYAKLKEILK